MASEKDFALVKVGPGVGAAKTNPAVKSQSELEDNKAKKAATDFEALLIHQMLSAMWKTVPKDTLLEGGREEEYYRDMLNEALSNSVAGGKGIGVRSVVYKELAADKSKVETAKDQAK